MFATNRQSSLRELSEFDSAMNKRTSFSLSIVANANEIGRELEVVKGEHIANSNAENSTGSETGCYPCM